MITQEEADVAQIFHYGQCRCFIGPRGGKAFSKLVAHRNGKTKRWKCVPEHFEIPVKHGMCKYGHINNFNAEHFHTPENCNMIYLNEREEVIEKP